MALALAVAGGGYALGRRDGRSLSRADIEQRLADHGKLLETDRRQLDRLLEEVRELDGQCGQLAADRAALERQLKEQLREQGGHVASLAQDTLALGTEFKGGLSSLEARLDDGLSRAEARQQQLLDTVDQQLQSMQAFIVQAAEEAKARREAIKSAGPVVMAPTAGVDWKAPATADMAGLMAQQRQAQEVFAARRRAEAQEIFVARRRAAAEAGFPNINGAGL